MNLIKINYMNKLFIYLIVIFLFTSCTKEVFVNEKPENKDYGQPPENFDLNIEKITDSEIIISWTEAIDPENENVTYEVTLFDSVVIYGLTNKYYDLLNLMPNTEYTIGVNAIDESLNKKSVSQNIKTKESLLKEAYWYDLGFNFDYDLTHAIKTSDNGILFAGRKLERYGIQFLLKLNSDFEIQWIKEYDWSYMDYITKLVELANGEYLIIRKESVTKINNQGVLIWVYQNPYNNSITVINSACEQSDGKIWLTGTTDLNNNENVKLEAFITKLDINGNEIWHKYYGTQRENRAEDIISKESGNIIIFGTSSFQFQGINYLSDCFWLFEIDKNGIVLNDTIYENKFLGSDVVNNSFALTDNSLLLCGSTNADFEGLGTDFRPRILRINEQNELLWDLYPDIKNLGDFPTFGGMIEITTQDFTFFSNSYRGVYIGKSNVNGVLTWDLKLKDFPNAMYMTKNKNGDFVYITSSGYLLTINPNGYFE